MIAVGWILVFCVLSVNSVLKIVSKGVIPSDFSCEGRISGYYADVQTGCQTYHFCESTRQYSYVCPNGTRFQQRMMVCFHAYMVDCENSEKDFDANLLIGREGEPFVKDFSEKSTFDPKILAPKFEIFKPTFSPEKPVISQQTLPPSIALLPPFEISRRPKSSKPQDSVIKLILNDTRNLFFISNQNSSTGEDLKTVQEFFIPVDNQITNFRFKKNPTVENGCPSYCHPKFLIPGTCHPCLMIK